MKTKVISILLLCLIVLTIIPFEIIAARGGGGRGGGGGGGRGGGGRGGGREFSGNRGRGRSEIQRNNIARTPTMSRANNWSPRTNEISRRSPSSSFLSENRPQLSQNRGGGQSRQQLQQFLGEGKIGNKQNLQNLTGANLSNLKQGLQNNNHLGNNLRKDIAQNYPNRSNWFNRNFWNDHNYTPLYNTARANWWARNTWGNVYGWLGWDSTEAYAPLYYDNGYAYEASQLGTPYETNYSSTTIYTQPSVESSNVESSDWLPLGVFAVTSTLESETAPTMFFQLALKKDGTIEGVYYNQAADQVHPVVGMVDPNTQKAVWMMSQGENSPVFETGLYNLTLDQTTVAVRFGSETQNWVMVRTSSE